MLNHVIDTYHIIFQIDTDWMYSPAPDFVEVVPTAGFYRPAQDMQKHSQHTAVHYHTARRVGALR